MSRPLRKNRRGYTAVEVLIAMTLFAIGAAGVIGMLKVTTQGASDARRFDIATNIANEWLARLQRDATFWTLPNDANPGLSNLTNTVWLKDVNNATCNGSTAGKYCTPAVPSSAENGVSPAFDIVGRDMPTYVGGGDPHFFCVQYRLSWIAQPTSATCSGSQLCPTALIRADIRVFWKRQEWGAIPDCATLTDDPDAVPNKYHFVYATTAIRENQLQ